MSGMQFKNKVLVLGLIAAALAAAYALGLVFSPTNVQKRRSEQLLLPGFKKEEVAKIEVFSDKADAIQVQQAENSWKLMIGGSPFPASAQRVGWFLDSMAGLRRARLVSASQDSWASFGVSDQAKTRIRLSDASGKSLVDLIVGNDEPGQRGSFARLEGSGEVVLLSRSLSTYLDGSLSYWSHLKFFPDELAGSAIMRISVRASLGFPDGTQRKLAYTLIRSSEGGRKWKVVVPAAQSSTVLDDKAVDRMANTLSDFEGNEFVPGSPDSGLGAPSAEILFSTENNRDYRILIGNRSDQDQYFAKVDGGEYLYLIPEWRVRTATQPLEDMQPK